MKLADDPEVRFRSIRSSHFALIKIASTGLQYFDWSSRPAASSGCSFIMCCRSMVRQTLLSRRMASQLTSFSGSCSECSAIHFDILPGSRTSEGYGVAKLSLEQRKALAEKRILSVLSRLTVANQRTLEQKISDAGPGDQRIDPHILTPVKTRLVDEGVLGEINDRGTPWFFCVKHPPQGCR
jgi:hypothetical protein